MECDRIVFTGHAVKRMFERSISHAEVVEIVRRGEIIREYPDDQPFPSYLMLGSIRRRPLHVVVAVESPRNTCYIVTVYGPDTDAWESDFRTRRRR